MRWIGHGRSAKRVQSTQWETKTAETIDHIVVSAVYDADRRKVIFFVLNRETSGSVDLSIDLRGLPQIKSCDALEIAGADLLAMSTRPESDALRSSERKEHSVRPDNLAAKLHLLSWNVLLLSH
jgi:alpha-L-arabinofuranosidase